MKAHLSDDRDFKLWILLNQARDVMFKAREKELRQYDISAVQAAVLFVLEAVGEKATATEISRWLLREHHTISSLLTRMEKEGLVIKARNSDKKSEKNVSLTEKGKRTYNRSLNRESIQEIMSCLSEEEHQQMGSLLEKLRDKALKNLAQVEKVPFP